LKLILYANTSEYLPTSEAVGFRVMVHDKWTEPFVDAFGEELKFQYEILFFF
jgi:hypothetical protein